MRAKSYTCGASQPSTDLVRATDDLLHGSFVPPTLRPHLITLFFRDLTLCCSIYALKVRARMCQPCQLCKYVNILLSKLTFYFA